MTINGYNRRYERDYVRGKVENSGDGRIRSATLQPLEKGFAFRAILVWRPGKECRVQKAAAE